MQDYSRLFGAALENAFDVALASERNGTAAVIACIIELEEQKLYLGAGYSSLHAYCVGKGLSDGGAFRRIHAARAARRFPALLDAIESGDLNLTSVNLLAPHLTEGNVAELIVAATRKGKPELEAILAERFPRSEFLAVGELVELPHTPGNTSPGEDPSRVPEADTQLALARVEGDNTLPGSASIAPAGLRSCITPIAARRYLLHLPIDAEAYALLQQAMELTSHSATTAGIATVLKDALKTRVTQLERRKCAKTATPRPRRSHSRDPRHVPAHVRRAVWERDGGQCTFVGEGGHRCECRMRLEFDHIVPVARGGEATVANLRLRCRAHNQYEAERVFGAEFMNARRAQARQRIAASSAPAAHPGSGEPDTTLQARRNDVADALRSLGFRADEVRRGIELSETASRDTLEQQLRVAVRHLAPKTRSFGPTRDILGWAPASCT